MEQYLRTSTAVLSLQYSSTGGSVLKIRTAQFRFLMVESFRFRLRTARRRSLSSLPPPTDL